MGWQGADMYAWPLDTANSTGFEHIEPKKENLKPRK
jgi:hypothetical protein